MKQTQERELRKINENIRQIVTTLQRRVVAEIHTGRLAIEAESGLIDLEENKGLIEGKPEVVGKVYRLIDSTNILLEAYIEKYGPLVPDDLLNGLPLHDDEEPPEFGKL